MEELGTQNSSTLHIKVTVESNRDGLEENESKTSNESSLLQPGPSNVTRSKYTNRTYLYTNQDLLFRKLFQPQCKHSLLSVMWS